jgi:hypothetical protein
MRAHKNPECSQQVIKVTVGHLCRSQPLNGGAWTPFAQQIGQLTDPVNALFGRKNDGIFFVAKGPQVCAVSTLGYGVIGSVNCTAMNDGPVISVASNLYGLRIAATNTHVYASQDDGLTWSLYEQTTSASLGTETRLRIVISKDLNGLNSDIFLLTDKNLYQLQSANTWGDICCMNGLTELAPPSPNYSSVAIWRGVGTSFIMLGDYNSGVLYRNLGSWGPFNNGLTTTTVLDLVTTAQGRFLAATPGGVFRSI